LKALKGPVVFQLAKSVDPIDIKTYVINRCCKTKISEGSSHNQGEKHSIGYARYYFDINVSLLSAHKTMLTVKDLEFLEEAICHLYDARRTTSKPSIPTVQVFRVIPSEDCELTDETILNRIKCVKNEGVDVPRSAEDYHFQVTPLKNVSIEALIKYEEASPAERALASV